ncbi:methyl-accepting chemotaxis protein, partial [Aurantimonas sp. C2-3-R2]|uniref:methyl-accepting chemotaxis protein n=4 Tax=unclassified Aurantimonas TaxID=2638230 RepID=UPI002E1774C1|nr:methyl-accepting chemotaxis protein [Aurantimonas sp. C2-3-R2]
MLRRLSLPAKVSIMVVACLAVLTVLFGVANVIVLREDGARRAAERQESNMRVAWEVLGAYGDSFRREGDSFYVGQQQLNDFSESVDKIKALVGGTATVFMGDKRVTTNVKKPDGSRAVGTVLARGPVYDALFADGRPYRGRADILGTPFFTAYDPIKDASGKTIGILYVGIREAEFFSSIDSLQYKLAAISLGAAIIIGLFVLWMSGRLFAPLKGLTKTIAAVADGRTDVTVVGLDREDEIGQMATSVEHLRHAVIERERLESEAAAARIDQEQAKQRQAALDNAKAEDLRAFVGVVEVGFERLSAGDLTVRMAEPVAAEFEPIRAKFNDSVGKLEDAIGNVVTSIGSIRSGLQEINTASNDLAQRTEQQAANLEETVAALGEVTTAVNETADGAGKAQTAASSARGKAQKGGEIVGQAVAAMSQIEKSSEQINQIIGVIDEIAFQTNLLALNAGVEAARAGEAGKGFAVVAQEVRGLAQRSAEAAKEIKTLIATSRSQVESGV